MGRVKLLLAGLLVVLAAPREPDVENPGGFWSRLAAPKQGEWLWTYPEKGQTFKEYKAADPVRETGGRSRIYLQPFLTRPLRDPRLLDRLRSVLTAYFGREVVTLERRPLPNGAYVAKRRQVSAFGLAPYLVRTLPKDALFVLAITDRDLFVGKLSRAFGWGSFTLRVGVMSTSRLGKGDAAPELRLRRAVTLATHEAGHMLSLPHCTFFGCVMNGARTLEEADRRPALLCPVCRSKLCWNLDLAPQERYSALRAAYRDAGLGKAADRIQGAADATSSTTKG